MSDVNFPQLPEDPYAYQNVFNYAEWRAKTSLQLCSVKWDNSYRDIMRFKDDNSRDAYFASLESESIMLNEYVYLKFGEPVKINIPFERAMNYNYLVVKNTEQPVPNSQNPDVLYYFVTSVVWDSPNCTALTIQLDVWQTFYHKLEFENCYVERGHVGIANENANLLSLDRYLVEPEGLNIGDYYEVSNSEFKNLMEEPPAILIVTTAALDLNDYGTVDNPNIVSSKGGIYNHIPSGASCWVVKGEDYKNLMLKLSVYPWVTQNIIMLTMLPREMVDFTGEPIMVLGTPLYELKQALIEAEIFWKIEDIQQKFFIPERYKNLLKFYTFPYTYMEMSTYNGNNVVLKQEEMSPSSQILVIETRFCLSPPNIRIAFYPTYYGNTPETGTTTRYSWKDAEGVENFANLRPYEELNKAVYLDNFPQFTVTTNSYLNSLASSAHSRAWSEDSADWSFNRNIMQANTAANQATMGIKAATKGNEINNWSASMANNIGQEKLLFNAQVGMAQSAAGMLGNAAYGNVAGAASSAVDMGLGLYTYSRNADWANRETSNAVSANNQQTQNSTNLSANVRDSNFDLAMRSNNGDYANAIAGIQAKVQDAKVIPPGTAGQTGGETFNFANGLVGIRINFRRPRLGSLNQVGEFWLRYGYTINRFLRPPSDMKCCEKFTYWKMTFCALNASGMPETFKEAIRGIFEKGVTIWHNHPDDINNVDLADNNPVKGVRY